MHKKRIIGAYYYCLLNTWVGVGINKKIPEVRTNNGFSGFLFAFWVHFEYKIAVSEYDGDISAGTYYAAETDPDRKVLSDLNPNIKVKDSAVFEISKTAYEAGGFTVCVDADKDFDVKIN